MICRYELASHVLKALLAGVSVLWLLRRMPLGTYLDRLEEFVPILAAFLVGSATLIAALFCGQARNQREEEVHPIPTRLSAVNAYVPKPVDESPPAKPPLPEPTADIERVGECIVCLEPIERSAIGSCPHHFCVHCLLECCRLTPRCPKCTTPINEVWLDTDFDVLLRHARAGEPEAEALARRSACEVALQRYVVHLRLPRGSCAGITLRDSIGRPGVAVSHLVERDMAYKCGLREGDLLVNMNGVPCRTHQMCVETIDRLSKSSHADEEVLCLVVPGGATGSLPSPNPPIHPPPDDDAADAAEAEGGQGERDEGWDCVVM